MQNFVFVLDTTKKPFNPIHPGQARRLLKEGKAAVFRRYPFTIILKEEVTESSKNITIKLDPGSKFTGIALVQDDQVIYRFGFPKSHAPKAKFFQGFQTGDLVSASIPKGKFAGQYTGRIAIRFRPSFVLQLPNKKFDVHPKYLIHIHRNDGYNYAY